MYALLALLATVSYLGLVRSIEDGGRRNRTVYILATVLMGYTHIYAYFAIAAQNVYVFAASVIGSWRRPSGGLRRWVTDQSIVAVALSPAIVLIADRLFGIASGSSESSVVSWIVEPSAWAPFTATAHHVYQVYDPWIVLFTLVSLAALFGYRFVVDEIDGDWTVLVVTWFLFGVFVPVAVSHLLTPLLVSRYTIVAAPALFLLVGESVATISSRIDAEFVRTMVVVGLVITLSFPLANYYQTPQREQWRGAASYIEENAEPGDIVIVSRNYTTNNFRFYYAGEKRVVGMPEQANATELRSAIEGYDRAWVVLSNMGSGGRSAFLDEMNTTAVPDGPRASWSETGGVGARSIVKSLHGVNIYRFDVQSP